MVNKLTLYELTLHKLSVVK